MNEVDQGVKAVFARAADIIEERGWCQLVHVDGEGRVCAREAVFRALEGQANAASPVPVSIFDCVNAWVAKANDSRYYSISIWNDEPRRTKDEVVAMFRELAMGDSAA